MIGKSISHYKILEKLGEGGMGVVYKAQDTKLDRVVALKFLPGHLTSDSVEKERFVHEAKTASGLNHPNICTIHAIEEQEGESFIVMEYVEGESLRSLCSKGSLEINKILDLISQATEGFSCAHRKGIIHRDIKSENLILTRDGRVKIMDFGLAARKSEKADEDSGTLAYMSPEQVEREELDLRTDIFSLGVVLYELLTGKLPFEGVFYQQVAYSILNEDPEPIRNYREDVPGKLSDILSKMLSKEKSSRYQDLSDLSIDLKNLRADLQLGIETDSREKDKDTKSIAVLPFEDWSPNKDSAYFSFNMIEEIVYGLSKTKKLKVASLSLVREYRPEANDLRRIGRELGVDYVVEGRVYKHKGELKVTAELVDVADGFQLWSGKFKGKLANVFDFQERVSRKIAQHLKLKLTKGAEEKITRKPPLNIQAYDFYLKGKEYYWKEGKGNLDFAIQMYKKTLEIDPGYALAHAGLGDAYVSMYMAYYDRSTTWLDLAEESCKKALSLEGDLPEARRALGRVYFEKGMPQEAIKECKKALELRPDYFEAYRTLGWLYERMGCCDEAIKWTLNSLKHSRWTDKESHLLLGLAYLDKGELDQAALMFEEALKLAPDYGRAHYYLANIQQKRGKLTDAIETYQKARELGVGLETQNIYLDTGWAHLMNKECDQAIKYFEQGLNLGDLDFIAFYLIGFAFEQTQQKESAILNFQKCQHKIKEQLATDPKNCYLYSFLGLVSTHLGLHQEGLDQGQKGVDLDPENGEILYNLARIFALQNNPEQALSTLRISLGKRISPSLAEAKLDPHFKTMIDRISPLE